MNPITTSQATSNKTLAHSKIVTSKTKTSFYRRLYLAYLIDNKINTIPAIIHHTGMPRRTAQDTLVALSDYGIDIEFIGGTKNGYYQINSWGAIQQQWIADNLQRILETLNYSSTWLKESQ